MENEAQEKDRCDLNNDFNLKWYWSTRRRGHLVIFTSPGWMSRLASMYLPIIGDFPASKEFYWWNTTICDETSILLKQENESEVCGSDSVHKRCWKFVKVQAKTRAVVSLVDTNVVEDIAMVSGCWLLHCVVPNHLGPAEGNNPISDHSRYILVD